ncbi:aminoglycoside 6-adenylyltransferase [Paenibacillus caseinilyticus]|uniref:Aminoglycoside 6-adenylyltransferase n=1 Tax=Paenibacillus mucilaginosus K02 TaxID=997761 RepID=I0BFF2_9BACL|nr:aminoglycoside 6-adenylyltransferase [Paenibacillus mucilaginosus]AFH61099.1 aminoglycoside 6-adenylyltransferase [Paenibacillus mucilaginosus K02]
MRTESEVIDQLLQFALADERVRAVILNGSRVNPNVTQDIFCDYDLIFVVTDLRYFLNHQEWIKRFGELIMMQQNDINTDGEDEYIFLMLFMDGIRIDLSFRRAETVNEHIEDSLSKVLLDKDNVLKRFSPPSEASYVTVKPSADEFHRNINNLLWCSTNAAKGLWRDELPYAKFMLDIVVRQNLMKLLSWYVGAEHNWSVNLGTASKWLKDYLPEQLWYSFERTYSGPAFSDIWESLYTTIRLAKEVGQPLAEKLNYEYPSHDHNNVLAYLGKVRDLPKDATKFP